MKPTIPLVLGGIAIGFAGAWFAKPDNVTTGQTAADSPRPSTRSESRATARMDEKPRSSFRSSVTVVGDGNDIDPEMQKSIDEAQKRQREMVR